MKDRIIVIGAGLAGLSAGLRLGKRAQVFESKDHPGGVAASYNHNGFCYDLGPHVLYFKEPSVERWVSDILGGRWRKINRRARIRIADEMVDYPLQEGFIRSKKLRDRYLDGLLRTSTTEEHEFESRARNLYGNEMADDFFIPYNRKLWRHPLDMMDAEKMKKFLPTYPREDLYRLKLGHSVNRGPNAAFFYPTRGGIGVLSDLMADRVGNQLHLSTPVKTIDAKRKQIETADGDIISYSRLIATNPLPEIIRMIINPPRKAIQAVNTLKSVGMVFVHLEIDHPVENDSHWIYYPDQNLCFHRISIPANYSKGMVPEGKGSLVVEISFASSINPDIDSLIAQTRNGAVKTGLVKSETSLNSSDVKIFRYAYVFPTRKSVLAGRDLEQYLKGIGIIPAGRYANWEYGNMESAIKQGIQAADKIC